jgi:hypothetical protein
MRVELCVRTSGGSFGTHHLGDPVALRAWGKYY